MLLIFMSEHMFRSRDQSVKIQREFSRYTSMALCFFYPHSVPIPHHPITNLTERGLTLLKRRNMLLSLWCIKK